MFDQFITQAKMIYVQDINQIKRKEALLDEAFKYAKTGSNFGELSEEYRKLSFNVKRIYANSFFNISHELAEKSREMLIKVY